MALSEFEVRKIEIVMGRFLEKKRPPPHLRNKVDIAYTISNQSVEIFEKREHWLDPSKSLNTPIAKATFVKRTKRWKLYWMPSDLKWHLYPDQREVGSIEEFVMIVEEDALACFWG